MVLEYHFPLKGLIHRKGNYSFAGYYKICIEAADLDVQSACQLV